MLTNIGYGSRIKNTYCGKTELMAFNFLSLEETDFTFNDDIGPSRL